MMLNKQLAQEKIVIWLFGLSGSGKSTIAALLEHSFQEVGFNSIRLDGDELREGINSDLGFSDADRAENVRRTAEMAKLLSRNDVLPVCALITPLEQHRNIAKTILQESFFDVFIDCPLPVCARRDVKGLYQKAFRHEIENFTGIDAAFERPAAATLTIQTDAASAEACAAQIFEQVLARMQKS